MKIMKNSRRSAVLGCLMYTILLMLPGAGFAQELVLPATGLFNGFNAQLNVLECTNLAAEPGYVQVNVFGNGGTHLGETSLFMPASGSRHLVINQFDIVDRIGTFVISQPDDGSMPNLNLSCVTSVYRMSASGSDKAVEYAFVLPISSALTGTNSGIYNSINPEGSAQEVFNWLSIYNPGDMPIAGSVRLFNQNGGFVSAFTIEEMPPGARADFPLGHPDGQVVGLYQVTLFDDSQPYGAFLTRYSQTGPDTFNFAFPLFSGQGACDSGPVPASTMDPAINWGEVANPNTVAVPVEIEVRDSVGSLLHSEVRTIAALSQHHIYINQYLGARNVGTFRVRCLNPMDPDNNIIVQSLFYGQSASNPNIVEWAYASQARGVFGEPGEPLVVPVNTNFGAANWYKVLNTGMDGADIQLSVYDTEGRKVFVNPQDVSQKNIFGMPVEGNLDLAVHQFAGDAFVGSASVSTTAVDGSFTGELLRVFPKTGGGIGYIMPVPAAQIRRGINADAREISVSIDKNTDLKLTASNEERIDDSASGYISQQPENGRVSGSWPDYVYIPDSQFRGDDSFEFRVFDGVTWSRPGRVDVHVDHWRPDFGVPEPAYGVRENAPALPSPWNQPVSGFYYVDRDAPGASDSGNQFGSPDAPRMTIPDILPAGSVVVLNGEYDHTQNGLFFSLASQGTAEQPIFIRAADVDNRPQITKPWHISGAYLVIENLEFANGTDDQANPGDAGRILIFGPAHHVALRYNEMHGNVENGGISIFGFLGQWVTDVVLYRNYIHNNGNRWGNIEDSFAVHGVSIGEDTARIWLTGNNIRYNGGDGLRISAGSTADVNRTHHIYVSGNDFLSNRYSGVWLQHASDIVISDNRARYHRPRSTEVEDIDSIGACMGYEYGPSRVWFLNNLLHDCEFGIASQPDVFGVVSGPGEEIALLGNLIRTINNTGSNNPGVYRDGAAIRLSDHGPLKFIVNNTIYDTDAGFLAPVAVSAYVIANNIMHLIPEEHIYVEQPLTAGASFLHNTMFDSVSKLKWGSGSSTRVQEFQAAFPGQCIGCFESNPRFEDAGSNNFRLTQGSRAIDSASAAVLGELQSRFQALYGVSIDSDFDENQRTVGAAPDMGVYEFGSGASQ